MNKLLVVDDDSGNRTAVVDVLMSEWPNCDVLTAPNGKIGLEVALLEEPEIILLDWEMPVMNGLAMLKALRAQIKTRDIPVVMYTGARLSATDLRAALEAGANEFLRKPMDGIELIARINSIFLQFRYFKEKTLLEQEKRQLEMDAKEKELLLKKNELTSLTLILEQRDHFLKDLTESLEANIRESNWESSVALQKRLVRDLKREMSSEKNWELIQVRMNSIHSGFLHRLVDKHPDLTTGDLKFCSLMKLNLSLKETANILHISVGGVEKRRYRLRRKLGLEAAEKIENYIHSLTSPVFA